MTISLPHRLGRLLPLIPLAGCVAPTPLHVERAGTLAPAFYDSFERDAAAHAGVTTFRIGGGYPEPKWAFAFDVPFDPHAAPLQIGRFVGTGTIPARVATALPIQLQAALSATRLFPEVTLQALPHAYVLSGTVTRGEDIDGFEETDAGTQVEATVSRDGAVLGAVQVNSLQIQVSLLSPLPSLIMSAAQGSRTAFVSERFAEAFQLAATGATHAIGVGGLSARYLPTPPGAAAGAAAATPSGAAHPAS